MKKSIKASLISALVFPGAGHLYLKKYTLGLALAVISMTALIYLVNDLVDAAQQISAGILSGAIQPDMESITAEVVSQQGQGSAGSGAHSLASIALLVCWLFGLFDAYRAGKLQDRGSD